MVNNLIAALRDDIPTLSWMGPETKKEALAKLQAFNIKIGYTDKWRDYSKLAIDRGSYAANVRRSIEFEHARQLAKIGQPVDRTEWGMTPPTVNAYYSSTMNEIVFPAGILQPPFYNPDADDAVNYGGIGAVIGHEISHGFDDQGSKFDGKGNLHEWWTPEDRKNFKERGDCVVKQFDGYEVSSPACTRTASSCSAKVSATSAAWPSLMPLMRNLSRASGRKILTASHRSSASSSAGPRCGVRISGRKLRACKPTPTHTP